MQDFNKLAASKKIEDKLKAVRDPVCPSGVITALINDDTITWDSTAGQKLINVIVSHSHTYINNLISIFSVWDSPILSSMGSESSDQELRKLIMQNPNWDLDEVAAILSEKVKEYDTGDGKCMIVGCITDASIIDENSKMKIYEIVSKRIIESGDISTSGYIYCLCDWTLKVMAMGDRELAETLLNQAGQYVNDYKEGNRVPPGIKADLSDYWDYKTLAETTIEFQADIERAEDAYESASAIYEMAIAKAENMDQWKNLFESKYEPLKMTVLKNPGCPIEILLEALKTGNDELKEAAAKSPAVKKLNPAGFGRFADPKTGEIVAKMQDGKLAAVEKVE